MDYTQFKNKFQRLPLILGKTVAASGKKGQAEKNQLCRWEKRGLIIKLKNGVYILNKNDRKITPSQPFIANQLYAPSYVSLEYALSYYGLIPERAFDVTSVTAKKTARFNNAMGNFTYRHITSRFFKGFILARDTGEQAFLIACAEKAVIDFLYFKLPELKINTAALLKDSYRFQNLEILNRRKMMMLVKSCGNAKLTKAAEQFCGLIRQEAG